MLGRPVDALALSTARVGVAWIPLKQVPSVASRQSVMLCRALTYLQLQLSPNIWLIFDGVILTNYRETLPSSSPGTDLLVNTINGTSFVVLRRIAINNRLCFPANISKLVSAEDDMLPCRVCRIVV